MNTKIEVLNILKAPHVTEKTTQLQGQKPSYAFKVNIKATKQQIAKAVEIAFSVTVDKVRTCTVKARSKRFGKVMGKRNAWKKAYVTLASGCTIELSE